MNPRRRLQLVPGLGFLLPNIAGFCAFTLVPLVMSFGMAFTNWDILRHNRFRHDALQWVGFGNYSRLFADPRFWRDLGTTLFFTLGLPFAIAGSLAAALLLTRVSQGRTRVGPAVAVATVIFAASAITLVACGVRETGVFALFGVLAGAVLVTSVATGGTLYRTLFYIPHFTAGVATFVLWKKLYNPHTGPINSGLAPILDGFSHVVRAAPSLFSIGLPLLCAGCGALIVAWQFRRLLRRWEEGDAGAATVVTGLLLIAIPFGFLLAWQGAPRAWAVMLATTALLIAAVAILRRRRRWGTQRPADTGLGAELGLALLGLPLLFALAAGIHLGPGLPLAASTGLEPPDWLGDYDWAKPALMIMALWAAIGSNSMILYLAGLSTIPPELYEAADLDGASAAQRFWHITWPQLAPVTFFIGVMGMINGLQGGFEMARTMTLGGPAGSTTTLSYFIFSQGFEVGRLGYASAIAWVMYALVMFFTVLNFRFGNRDASE